MKNNEINSTEEIKQNILFSLEKKGVLENLKAYLRSNIYSNLKEKEETLSINKNPPNSKIDLKESDNEKIKTLKITISLIADFLKKMQLSYCHSVFLPEIRNLIKDELYSESELSKIFETSSDHNLSNISSNYFSILNNIISQRSTKISKKSNQTQTESEGISSKSFTNNIDEKFKEIDIKYSKNISLENLMPAKSLEEKMLKFQRDYELRHREDLEREVKRIKEIELSQLRIEENRKYLKKIDEVREEYQQEYRENFEYLKKKEIEVNFRISQKEKELETQIYENRQKFLNELELLKRKEEELKRKYENDLNNFKLEEEKLKFKQKEIDYLKESSEKKVKEEIEQFKIEYNRMFEMEKKEFRKKKMEFEEKDFKNNLFIEKMKNCEEENIKLKEEKENINRDLNDLRQLNYTLQKEIRNLKDELKSLYENEKRKSDFFGKIELENSHLKDEIKFLKDSLEILKKSSEERKSDQIILIENLKIQLTENTKRFENHKEQFEREIQNLKKYYHSSMEFEERNKILKNQKVIQENEYKVLLDKYNQLLKKNSETKKKNLNKIINLKNQELPNDVSKTAKFNNFIFENKTPNDRFAILSKLEKEHEEIKNEFKKSFNENSSKREDKMSHVLQNPNFIERIYSDLYDKINSEKFSPIIDSVRVRKSQVSSKNKIVEIKEKNNKKDFINEFNEKERDKSDKKNSFIYEQKESPIRKKEIDKKSQEIIHLSYSKQSKDSRKSIEYDNPTAIKIDNRQELDFINKNHKIINQENEIDKLPQKVNEKQGDQNKIQIQNIESNLREKDQIIDIINNFKPDEKIENISKSFDVGTDGFKTTTQKVEEKINIKIENLNETSKKTKITDMIPEERIENKLNELRKEVESLPNSIVISEINVPKNINKEPSEKNESINDISVANLTSSNEWENESQKNKSSRSDLNKFNLVKNSNTSTKLTSDKINHGMIPSLIVKEMNLKSENPTQNLNITEINSNNLNKNINNYSIPSDIKEEFSESANKHPSYEAESNKKANDFNKIRPTTTQNEIENISHNNFNKFSTFNFGMDNNDIEEDEIKTENDESENYEYDFVEDVDGLEKKGSIDLDAINRNVSLTNNSVTNNKLNQINNKSIMKSQSMDKYIDKFLQSKVSNVDDNIVEEISYENSKKELIATANANSIEEDSALKYNDYYESNNYNQLKSMQENYSENNYNDYYQSNQGFNSINSHSINQIRNMTKDSAKDISQKFVESKGASDIREEIIDEDAYEPIDHDDYY